MSRVRIAVVALAAVVLGTAGIVQALDCEGRLVVEGASSWGVQIIGGDPVQVNDTLEVVLKPVYDAQGRVAGHVPVGVPKPVWTDNFGSSRLLSILTFLEGALVKIDSGGYGHEGLLGHGRKKPASMSVIGSALESLGGMATACHPARDGDGTLPWLGAAAV
jgi:hypothetical protein